MLLKRSWWGMKVCGGRNKTTKTLDQGVVLAVLAVLARSFLPPSFYIDSFFIISVLLLLQKKRNKVSPNNETKLNFLNIWFQGCRTLYKMAVPVVPTPHKLHIVYKRNYNFFIQSQGTHICQPNVHSESIQ